MIHQSTGDTDADSPAERRRERRRRAILDEALARIHEGGLEALTIHGLAKALDYTPGALYRYFDGREDLLLALQVGVAEDWGRALSAVRARCAGRAPDRRAQALLPVLATGALFADLAAAEPARFALIGEVLGASRHVLSIDAARRLVSPLLAVLAQVAADLVAAEGIALSPGAADRRALALLGAVQGVLQLRKLERLAPPGLAAAPLVPDLVRALLAGWGAPTDALDAAERALVALTPLLPPGGSP